MRTWRARLAWLTLAVIAGLTSWLIIANRDTSQPASAHAAAPLADYSLQDAVITRYARTGKPQYVLHSTLVTHETDSATSQLSDVELNYYSPSSPYWRLSAEQGKLSDNGNHIVLIKHVRAHQPAASQPIHLATSQLTLLLQKHLISSKARVTLRQGAREARGTGLKADLDSGVVKLLKNVTSRYVD